MVALVLSAACVGDGGRERPTAAPPARCETPFTVPPGFRLTESLEDPYPDHVGVRLGFRDRERRELHVFVGIPGEFGEGLPAAGAVSLAAGEDGRLLGADATWVLAWDSTGPCAVHAVLGNGFTRVAFLRVLEESGVVE